MGKEPTVAQRSIPTRRRNLVYVALLGLAWAMAFMVLSDDSLPPIRSESTSEILPVRKLSCADSFWDPEECGIEGVNCEPFSDHHVAFHCPANCLRDGAVTGKPHLAGGQEVLNKPLVIGGPIYRGDSYICPAAIHAGAVDGAKGGCGVAKLMGMTNSFSSTDMYGVESVDVQTYFPKTFRFTIESDDMECPAERNTKSVLPYVSAVSSALVFRATSSTAIRAAWALAVMYAHLSLSRGPTGGDSNTSSRSSTTAPGRGVDEKIHIPVILEPVIFMDSVSNITFTWATPVPDDVDGISMLVDDVERARRFFRGAGKNDLKEGEDDKSFFWQRTPQAFVDYVRFGYVKDGKVLKYSKPGIWFTNGTWTGISSET